MSKLVLFHFQTIRIYWLRSFLFQYIHFKPFSMNVWAKSFEFFNLKYFTFIRKSNLIFF
jgi:hypothetical protein